MADNLISSIVTVLTAIIGIAIIAVLVSNRAQTAQVVGAGGNAFSQAIEAAVSPVTGNSPDVGGNFGYGGASQILHF
jgi:PRD1 phage membrane DNA delivery